MLAIRLEQTGGIEELKLIETPAPEPGHGEVRIKVEAAGVNFADVLIRRGLYLPMPNLPVIPGTDVAGTIDALGEGAEQLSVGQRVVATIPRGGYAQYATAPTFAVVPLPAGIDFDLASGLPVSGMTAYHLTHTITTLASGMTVVNYAAAGSVGSLIIGMAKTQGAKVIALVGSEAKACRARELGAEAAINYLTTDDVPAAVRELNLGQGVDVVYNSVMGKTVADDLNMLKPLGHAIWFGIAGGLPNSKLLLASFMRHFPDSPTITFYHLLSSLLHDQKRHVTGWSRLFTYLLSGQAQLPIHAAYPLAQAAQAHSDLENRRTMGKCVLKPWAEP